MDNIHPDTVPIRKRLKLDEASSVTAFEASHLTDDNNGVIVLENSYETATLAIYLPHRNELNPISSLTPEMVLSGESLLCVREQIYIFVRGGRLFRFDPDKLWTEMCQTAHYHDTPAIEMDGFAYVLGSTTSQYCGCERYNPCMNSWTCVGYTEKSSNYCCYATLNGWIYAIGFKDGGPTARGVGRFNPYDGVWDDVAPIKGIIEPISAATLHNKIYVLGDDIRQNWSSSIEFYNRDLGVWTVAVRTTLPVHHIGLFTMDQGLAIVSKNHPRSAQVTCVKFGTVDLQNRSITFTTDFPNMSLDRRFLCTLFKVPRDYLVTIHVDGVILRCSLTRLSERNHYFESMFSLGFLEDHTRTVTFSDVDQKAMKLCIERIETGVSSPLNLILLAEIEKYVHCARMLLLDDFVKDLSREYIKLLSVETFEEIIQISYKYDLLDLEEACDLFATENFEQLTTQACFLSMELEYVKSMVKSQIQSVPQINVLEAVIVWVEHDSAERKKYHRDLLSFIDFNRIELFHLMSARKETSNVFANSRTYQKLLDKAIRKRTQRHQVLLLKDADNDAFSVYVAKRTKSTRIRREFDEDIKYCFTALDNLYVFDKSCRLFCFPITDPKAVWVEKPQHQLEGDDMKFAVSGDGICSCLFVFGKNEGARFHCAHDVWTTFTTYEKRENFAVVGCSEWIYLLGGKEVSEQGAMSTGTSSSTDAAKVVSNSVVRYNILSNKWCEDVAAMERARYDATALECCGKIYALGGKNELDGVLCHCEQYDPMTNVWTEIKETKKLRSNFTAIAADGKIFLLSPPRLSWCPRVTISTYDQRKNMWRSRGSVDGDFSMESIISVSLPYDWFAVS